MMRRLNDNGLARMTLFLETFSVASPPSFPKELLDDAQATSVVEPAIEIEDVPFQSRLHAAGYLNDLLGDAGIENIERDRGLWAWLALFYSDQLCPTERNGTRDPGEIARWIPVVGDFRKYYRHLLAGPFRIYRAHRDRPERALILLGGPLHSPGEIVEQIAAYQELVTNRAIVEAATTLYHTSERRAKHFKSGAAGKGAGSARRFVDVMNQFDVTWDLYAMEAPQIVQMLPREFSRFLPQ